MQRRCLLRSLGISLPLIAGCVSVGSDTEISDGTQHAVSDVQNPLKWLHERGDCDPLMGSLELAEPTDSVPETTAVAAHDRLPEETKTVVRFAIHRGSAVTCSDTGGSVFDRLVSEIHARAVDSYREDRGVRPRSIALDTGDRCYPITELSAFDAVLV
jgi:hypothetical protein